MGRAAYGVRGIDLEKGDYVVGMATTPKPGAPSVAAGDSPAKEALVEGKAEAAKTEAVDEAVKGTLILSVTENGFGKRTPADEYRLIGKISGDPPFTGRLIHKGWKTDTIKLPRIVNVDQKRLPAIAPAEVIEARRLPRLE